jgi:hypothetical protein
MGSLFSKTSRKNIPFMCKNCWKRIGKRDIKKKLSDGYYCYDCYLQLCPFENVYGNIIR